MKQKRILIGFYILLLASITTVNISLAQNIPPLPPQEMGYTEQELPCDTSNPYPTRTEIKNKKKIAKLTNQLKKLKGTWQFTDTAYFGPCFEGPYKLETGTDTATNGNEHLTVTFQNNGFCTNYFEDPINGGSLCEKPTFFYTNGTFGDLRGGQAFMKLNKSKLEFYSIGKGGYEKIILKKVSKTRK